MPGTALIQPLLTKTVALQLVAARDRCESTLALSADLGKTNCAVKITPDCWVWQATPYPYPEPLKERTVYAWNGSNFEAVAIFSGSLVKLIPTDWGPPTFEIDGIKMLPTLKVSPFDDARRKVALIQPRGKRVLDCCGGLGYFAHWCLNSMATTVHSFEKNDSVLWLRGINPWSPSGDARLQLHHADIAAQIYSLPARSFDAILHDPPRFGIAGELYSQKFYDELARVITKGGLLFHYTGTPNKLTSGRDVPKEVMRRLQKAGFKTRIEGDGIMAQRA